MTCQQQTILVIIAIHTMRILAGVANMILQLSIQGFNVVFVFFYKIKMFILMQVVKMICHPLTTIMMIAMTMKIILIGVACMIHQHFIQSHNVAFVNDKNMIT